MTLTERKTRKEHILKIRQKTAASVYQAIQSLKTLYGEKFPSVFKSITSDNGSEFTELTQAVAKEGVAVYYTHPYTSCERGTNERHNGLIRRFIPKGKDIGAIDDTLIRYVEKWCNTLPRKILGYQAPNDQFVEEINQLA